MPLYLLYPRSTVVSTAATATSSVDAAAANLMAKDCILARISADLPRHTIVKSASVDAAHLDSYGKPAVIDAMMSNRRDTPWCHCAATYQCAGKQARHLLLPHA